MVRALLLLPILPLLAACSLGSQSLGLGFAGFGGSEPEAIPTLSNNIGPAPDGSSGSTKPQVAAFDGGGGRPKAQRAPGTDEDASDYAKVNLDVEKARKAINKYRKAKGLKPLAISAELTNAAKAHSRDLAKWDRISHYGSDGSTPWDRVEQAGFKARLAAENVGTGQESFDEVFTGWKNSASHNKNLLLADATHMGIALVNRPGTQFKTFWTLVIGTPM